MLIKWLGHACFSITSQTGLKIITDPYEFGFRDLIHYNAIGETADIVTVSHEHGDHNCISAVAGDPAVIIGRGITMEKGIEFNGIACYHDQASGSERGANTIFTFEVDDIRLTHLGDLGHQLNPQQLGDLEGTEILFAPTGGPLATLELQTVIELWEMVKPRVVIPMHFKTAKCPFPKYGVDDLIQLRPTARKAGASEVSFTKDKLPQPVQILILDPSR